VRDRLRAEGFRVDQPLYRGQGGQFGDRFPEHAYLTSSPPVAEQALGGVEGGAIYPVFARHNRLAELSPREMEDLGYRPQHIAELQRQGYDGAFSGDEYLIFDHSKNVRSATTGEPFYISPQDGFAREGLSLQFDGGRWEIIDAAGQTVERLPAGTNFKSANETLSARRGPARGPRQ